MKKIFSNVYVGSRDKFVFACMLIWKTQRNCQTINSFAFE